MAESGEAFATRLLRWFPLAARELPWRGDRSPYRVLVSETMLQQTTVAVVAPYFERFMRAFPNWHALAIAEPADVLARWAGLGYYQRARRLQAAARAVVARGGELPSEPEALRELPGIGPYTAAAVASLAFGVPAPAVDGNVARVLSRHCGRSLSANVPADRRRLEALVAGLMPADRAGDFTEALMELGATTCLPRAPLCDACPVAADCVARQRGRQAQIPAPRQRAAPTQVRAAAAWIERNGRVLLRRRPKDSPLLAGLWELPGGFMRGRTSPARWLEEHVLSELGGGRAGARLSQVRHAITHRRITVHVHECELQRAPRVHADLKWVAPRKAQYLGLTAATTRALARCGDA